MQVLQDTSGRWSSAVFRDLTNLGVGAQNLRTCSWEEKIIIRGYVKDLSAKPPGEVGSIVRIPEAKKYAVPVVKFPF